LLEFSYEILAPFVLRDLTPVYFVQVGANDGILDDPIHPFVQTQGWRGVLIEPQPNIFEVLRRSYAGSEGLTFINAAIDHRPGRSTLYCIEPHTDVPDWTLGIASFDKGVLLRHNNGSQVLSDTSKKSMSSA
jgi:hypothetical protein